jgi:branched-chain amino acid transport system ATP-binding protein
MTTLLGANGAGKTTSLRAITGAMRPRGGKVVFAGEDVTWLPAHAKAARGLVLVPEGRQLFSNMSVEENLEMGAYSHRARQHFRQQLDHVYTMFPRLKERRDQKAGTFSGGEQQMLAIARALMTNPSLLLLDEPLEGLAPIVIEELAAAIRRMTSEGSNAFILVEQHAEIALSLTQNAIVIERGRIVHSGTSAPLLADHATLDRLVGLRLAEA